MYTDTFTIKPADKNDDPLRNPNHNCPARHQLDVNLVSWRLDVSEKELTYGDAENVMNVDAHNLPCYFADGFCKLTTKLFILFLVKRSLSSNLHIKYV